MLPPVPWDPGLQQPVLLHLPRPCSNPTQEKALSSGQSCEAAAAQLCLSPTLVLTTRTPACRTMPQSPAVGARAPLVAAWQRACHVAGTVYTCHTHTPAALGLLDKGGKLSLHLALRWPWGATWRPCPFPACSLSLRWQRVEGRLPTLRDAWEPQGLTERQGSCE